MKKSDIGLALYLLAAVIFFIVPINSTLLDAMLAVNIQLHCSCYLTLYL